MIDKLTIKNYKLFKEKQTLEIKPITILIGKNNSGKSAILKLLTIIEGALKSKDKLPLKLNNDEVISGNLYRDLVYGKFGRPIEIELFEENIEESLFKLSLGILVDGDKNLPLIETWSLSNLAKNKILIDLQNLKEDIYLNKIDNEEYKCYFRGINLEKHFDKNNNQVSVSDLPIQLNTDFIGSIREKTKLDYRINPINTKSNITGKYLYDFLIRDYLTTDKKYFTQISNWITNKFNGWELYIDTDGGEPYHIQIRRDKLEIDITETGMGIGQSLPLIIRAFKPCEEETLVIIEEPEAHLHPFAHGEIAELISDSVLFDTRKKYIIETHSKNFILRLRSLIAEGKVFAESVVIYYVDFDEVKNESKLKQILLDENGKVDWWPEGVFGESLEETIRIRTAQINRDVD